MKTYKTYNFIEFLKLELGRRKAKNFSYSVRAFARDLHIDSSLLNKYLNGKRRMNDEFIDKIGISLGIETQDRKLFQALNSFYTYDIDHKAVITSLSKETET